MCVTQSFVFPWKCASGMEPIPSWSCSQAASKPVWHIPLLCVQWKTPDDGQKNCPKHVEFYFKNRFEKLVHLVGSVTRMLYLCCEPGFRTVCCFPFWMAEGYPHLLMPEEFSRVVGRSALCFCLYLLSFFLILFELGSCQDRHPRANKKSNYTTCACNLDCLHEGGLWSRCHFDTLSGQTYLWAENWYTNSL